MQKNILIIGACGQIGTELTYTLRALYGNDKVIASDIREGNSELMQSGPFEMLDATDFDAVEEIIAYHEIDEVYLICLLYTSPSPRDRQKSRMPSSA